MPRWVSRTYTYVEPIGDPDSLPESNGIDGPDTLPLRGAGSKPDFDAGYDAGYRAGWSAGYEYARKLNDDDLAAKGAGESPSFSAIMRP